jgi:cell division protein FtsN
LLLLGLGIGGAAVVLVQLVLQRDSIRGGLAGLFTRSPAEKPATKKEPEAPRTAKPKFDFYTILPETETVLPERSDKPRIAKTAKTEKPEEGVNYILQAGSFVNYQDADQLKARLALAGLVAHIQKVTIEGKGEFHRVRLGPYDKFSELDAAAARLEQQGIKKPLRLKVRKAP